MCLATMAYVYAACIVRVTTFSTGGKFQPVSNFTESHTLTQATRSYTLLQYSCSDVSAKLQDKSQD